MPTRSVIDQLGKLVRAFREAKALTQDELVNAIDAKTNRSVIAHLEQGLRLPSPEVLRSICVYLNIPESLWISFESPGLRDRINSGATATVVKAGPAIIAVAGIMGSGKTTLARQLASNLGYHYISESRQAIRYLNDLFRDPKRWAFETQLAFLIHKATDIMRVLERGEPVVLDRSLSEDIEIFARYFQQEGAIDKRGAETYSAVAAYFETQVPPPDIVLYCHCSIDAALERIAARQRDDQDAHSREHIANIALLYDDWVHSYNRSSVYKLDSEKWDWRETIVFHRLSRELEGLYEPREPEDTQFDLFSKPGSLKRERYAHELQILEPIIEMDQGRLLEFAYHDLDLRPLPYPSAYIAAPFTALAKYEKKEEEQLFDDAKPHGAIGRGRFRDALLRIEAILAKLGIACLIPHRDVNQWGHRILSADRVTPLCTEQVTHCDLFVGIIGESHGAHYEFGLARAQAKPCVVVHCRELGESFIASGVTGDGHSVLSISCDRISEIANRLDERDVREFLGRFF